MSIWAMRMSTDPEISPWGGIHIPMPANISAERNAPSDRNFLISVIIMSNYVKERIFQMGGEAETFPRVVDEGAGHHPAALWMACGPDGRLP